MLLFFFFTSFASISQLMCALVLLLAHQKCGVVQQDGGNCHASVVTTASISGVPKEHPVPQH